MYTTIEFTDTSRSPTSTHHFLPAKSYLFHQTNTHSVSNKLNQTRLFYFIRSHEDNPNLTCSNNKLKVRHLSGPKNFAEYYLLLINSFSIVEIRDKRTPVRLNSTGMHKKLHRLSFLMKVLKMRVRNQCILSSQWPKRARSVLFAACISFSNVKIRDQKIPERLKSTVMGKKLHRIPFLMEGLKLKIRNQCILVSQWP